MGGKSGKSAKYGLHTLLSPGTKVLQTTTKYFSPGINNLRLWVSPMCFGHALVGEQESRPKKTRKHKGAQPDWEEVELCKSCTIKAIIPKS